MDQSDIKILGVLQEDGRVSNKQLAEIVGLSPSSVHERVKKLEKKGFIERYTAILSGKKLGLETVIFVSVSLNLHNEYSLENFSEFINNSSMVSECYHLAGSEDYLLKIHCRDIKEYERFLVTKLTRIDGMDRVKTHIVLKTMKHGTELPLETVTGAGPAV
jgi:DNA-binding Lrp family transcriptional regulator